MFFRTITTAAALAATLATMPAVGAQAAELSPWSQGELKEMDAAGYGAPVDALTFEGAAAQGQTGQVVLTIPADGAYALIGSCGGDCTDIGLILQQNGATVAEGVTGFHATLKPGAYQLMIGFDNCKAAQCRYVVRAYRVKS